jgi:hypothetical protein
MRIALLAAITRAQALLIVIGDPEVLGKYEHWRTFLKYVKLRKGWNGRMHNWDGEEVIPPGYETIPSSTSEMDRRLPQGAIGTELWAQYLRLAIPR